MKTKETILTLCGILAVSSAMVLVDIEGQDTPHLLGEKACTSGPSYWCQNITTAAGCNAMKHCIPKVWEKMTVPEDKDSVCQICKDMVKQARDQLESNQTQEDLKAVFEGSCALMQIKVVVKECDKLVDQFIPELVETLASQMDPSVVCSVSGLCNSRHIDELLEQEKGVQLVTADGSSADECTRCFTITRIMEDKFAHTSRDKVLEQFLTVCGQLSSFSDACSAITLRYFEQIYAHLQENFNSKNVCHISGQCAAKFHVHEDSSKTPEVEIRPLSSVGMVSVQDDLPCKLCEQLVGHLRDLLVANTTEVEFETVLRGLCKQTGSFASECKAIVEQYYPEIYEFLTRGLNGNLVCQMGGICPAPGKAVTSAIAPLVPDDVAQIGHKIMNERDNKEPEVSLLPIDRFTGPFMGLGLVDDKYCSSCEFVTHYLKQLFGAYIDRKQVETAMGDIENLLVTRGSKPLVVSFLAKYHQAIISLVLQGKDLDEICGLVAVCPTKEHIQLWEQIPDSAKIPAVQEKPNCPLCLLAVTQLYNVIKDNKTEANIEAALDKLCLHLPKNLNSQCEDLVKGYSKELIHMLLQDLTPQEVCAYIKLCDGTSKKATLFQKVVAVPKMDVEGKEACALCEYVLHYIQTVVTNPKAEDEVKQVLDKVCNILPKSIQNNCMELVNLYGDAVVSILAQGIDPSQVCPMIHICPTQQLVDVMDTLPKDFTVPTKVADKPNCPLCLFGITQLYNVLKDNRTEETIQKELDALCIHLPKGLRNECDMFVDKYSKEIIETMVADLSPQEVCVYLQLCEAPKKPEPEIEFYPLDKNTDISSNEIPMYIVDETNNLHEDASYTGDYASPKQEDLHDFKEDVECQVCKMVLEFLEKEVDNKKSKEEIDRALHGACNKLPRRFSVKCNTFIDEYADIVIALLTQEVSSKEVCTIMGLCKAETAEIRDYVTDCATCQRLTPLFEVLHDTKDLFEIDENKGKLAEIMDNLCTAFPPGMTHDKCKSLIRMHKEEIMAMILSDDDPTRICNNLELCSPGNFVVMLFQNERSKRQVDDKGLGTKRCTWGPSYWCLDDKTAEECKATEHCKKVGRLQETKTESVEAEKPKETASP